MLRLSISSDLPNTPEKLPYLFSGRLSPSFAFVAPQLTLCRSQPPPPSTWPRLPNTLTKRSHQPPTLQMITRRDVDENGTPTPMDWMFEARTYKMHIRYNTTADGKVWWK